MRTRTRTFLPSVITAAVAALLLIGALFLPVMSSTRDFRRALELAQTTEDAYQLRSMGLYLTPSQAKDVTLFELGTATVKAGSDEDRSEYAAIEIAMGICCILAAILPLLVALFAYLKYPIPCIVFTVLMRLGFALAYIGIAGVADGRYYNMGFMSYAYPLLSYVVLGLAIWLTVAKSKDRKEARGFGAYGPGGYPQQGGYPQRGGYPQQGGYTQQYPTQGGYQQGGYQQGGYQQGGYQQGGNKQGDQRRY